MLYESLGQLQEASRNEAGLLVGTRTLETSIVYIPGDFDNA